MIKKILNLIINGLRNLGIIIFSLIGINFTKSKKENKEEEASETSGGSQKDIKTVLPTDEDTGPLIKKETMNPIPSKLMDYSEPKNKEKTIITKFYNEETYEKLGIKIYNDENLNIIIKEVFENSIADKAGLETGDIITKVNDISFKNTKTYAFIKEMEKLENKEKKIKVIRNDKEEKVIIKPVLNAKENEEKQDVIVPDEIKLEENKEENAGKNILKSESLTESVKLSGAGVYHTSTTLKITEKQKQNAPFIEEVKQEKEKNEDQVLTDLKPNDKEVINTEPSNIIESVTVVPIIKTTEKVINENKQKDSTIDKNSNDLEIKEEKEQRSENNEKNKTDDKEEDKKEEKKESKEEITEREALMISKVTDEDIKEKEEKIEKSYNEKKTLLDLLKVDNRFKIGLMPFMIFKRRMVRNVYKAYLLNNSLVGARRLLGASDAHFQRLNYMDLVYHIRTTNTFKNMTFDNLYQIDMLKVELQNKYGNDLKTDPDLIDVMDRIDYLESRTIARHQRLIEKERELLRKKQKRLILTKKEGK